MSEIELRTKVDTTDNRRSLNDACNQGYGAVGSTPCNRMQPNCQLASEDVCG